MIFLVGETHSLILLNKNSPCCPRRRKIILLLAREGERFCSMLPKKENILLLAKVPRFSNIGARGLILSESAVQYTSEKYQSHIRTYEDKCLDGAER